jgi:dimeric dUTPase (all-alpha-NTP-PPase superfamily)
MNLQKLFEMQRQLDEHIEKEHPREPGEDRLAKKILALQVELGELANELPEVFKFWSNKKNNYEKALKEYVDGLHFILSIGLELNIDPKLITGIYECPNVLEQFNSVFEDVAHFWSSVNEDWGYEAQVEFYVEIFRGFKALGRMLGFTQKQVEEAYLRKNAINHQRQESGY